MTGTYRVVTMWLLGTTEDWWTRASRGSVLTAGSSCVTGLGFLEGGGSLATGLELLTIPISREKAFDLLENDALEK